MEIRLLRWTAELRTQLCSTRTDQGLKGKLVEQQVTPYGKAIAFRDASLARNFMELPILLPEVLQGLVRGRNLQTAAALIWCSENNSPELI